MPDEWSYFDGKTIPSRATAVNILLVYTDIQVGHQDMPAVIGLWTGTRNQQTGEWYSVLFLKRTTPQLSEQPKNERDEDEIEEVEDGVSQTLSAKLGYGLQKRPVTNNGQDSGYTIVKPKTT